MKAAAVGAILVGGIVWSAYGGGVAVGMPEDATEPTPCRVTLPNGRVPLVYGLPARSAGVNHGNGRLFVSLWQDGEVVVPLTSVGPNGEIQAKFPWWRSVRGRLRITAARLDADAPSATAHIPSAYGNRGFQSTMVTFPTTGCWRVTGRVGLTARLSFVTLVVVRSE